MAKQVTKGSSTPVLDPSQMSEDELRAYVAKLEKALANGPQQKAAAPQKEWGDGEKRWVNVPKTPTNDIITINGKPYIGRVLVNRETWYTLLEMHGKAVRSELARMESRGNLVEPHLLAQDDISSRHQPITIANL